MCALPLPPQAELAALLQTEILAREAVATEKLGVLEEQETLRSLRHKLALKQVAVLKALQAPAVFPPVGPAMPRPAHRPLEFTSATLPAAIAC